MRWPQAENTRKWKSPKNNDVRQITKFLWFPTNIDDEWRWFEMSTIAQVYFQDGDAAEWLNERWVNPKGNK